jgi:predicted DNA-binding transcriptional regulator AlpA
MTLHENAGRRPHRKHKLPSPAEAERRTQQSEQTLAHRDRVLSFGQWCDLNNFSEPTGRRIIQRGEGPVVLQLSTRRIGVRESDNRAWQESRVR